jgi:SAP domain
MVKAEASYEANTVEELRVELERRELPKTGTKAELIERLEADDAAKVAPASWETESTVETESVETVPAEAESAEAEPEGEPSYEANTVAELSAELESRELPKSGTKAELIERLETDDNAETTARVEAGQCVVDDGTPHTGRAVNGLVCSAHANRYHADGTPRP